MDETVFSNIFAIISDFLPPRWNRMVFYACYTGGSYSMKFFYMQDGGEFIDCFHIPEVSQAKLFRAFLAIDKTLSTIRNGDEKGELWTVFTMMVDGDGGVKAEFEYEDHSEDMIEYESKWMDKYLK